MLSSFATTETNEQLKDDEKKRKQPGIGTQEPVKKTARDRDPRTYEENSQGSGPQGKCKVRVSTTYMQNLRTRMRTNDGRANAGGRVEAQPGAVEAERKERALEHADEWKWMAKEMDWSHDASNTKNPRGHTARADGRVERTIRVPRTRQVDTQRQDQ